MDEEELPDPADSVPEPETTASDGSASPDASPLPEGGASLVAAPSPEVQVLPEPTASPDAAAAPDAGGDPANSPDPTIPTPPAAATPADVLGDRPEPSPDPNAGATSTPPSLRPSKRRKRHSPLVVLLAGAAAATLVGVPLKLFLGREAPPAETIPTAVAPDAAVFDAGTDADPVDAGDLLNQPAAVRPKNWRVRELSADASIELKQGKIGKHPFTISLTQAGMSKPEVQRLVRALRPVLDVDHMAPDDSFVAAIDRAKKRIVAFEFSESPTEVWQAREEDGQLSAKKLSLTMQHRPIQGELNIESDAKAAIEKAGYRSTLLPHLETALEGHARLSEIHAGSQIRFLGVEVLIDDEFWDYGDLRGVEVVFPKHSHGARFYRYEGHAIRGFFDAAGKQPIGGGWRSPVPFARISSRFNPRRTHPVLKVVMPHNGVDFAAPPGTPVYSTGPGTLKFIGDSGPCGNMIHVLHENGLVSAYCHLQRFAPGLSVGKKIAGRDLLGFVGQTGRATGPHLHFAIKRGEGFIDPLSLKLDRVKVVPDGEAAEFERVRREVDVGLDGLRKGAGADAGADEDDQILDEEAPDAGNP